MGLHRQEYWSGVPFPSPGDLPKPGMEPESSALAGRFFPTEPPGKPRDAIVFSISSYFAVLVSLVSSHTSAWLINTGEPQGSPLGPLFPTSSLSVGSPARPMAFTAIYVLMDNSLLYLSTSSNLQCDISPWIFRGCLRLNMATVELLIPNPCACSSRNILLLIHGTTTHLTALSISIGISLISFFSSGMSSLNLSSSMSHQLPSPSHHPLSLALN